MNIQQMKVADLRPFSGNAKKHDDTQIKNVMQSIKEYGIVQPLVCDKDNTLIIGHCRLLACKRLGIKEVPVVRMEELTEEEANKLRLLDNKLNESEWDFELLAEQVPDLDFSDFDIDWNLGDVADWFSREEKDGTAREEGNDEYNDFLDKFETKKTTDDCYTPGNIYDVVADWVTKEYNVKRETFIRPFYPNGDYQREDYRGRIVVDNPPFSILAQIIDFYVENGIRFFLFAPGLATLNYVNRKNVCAICSYASVVYENGAIVTTSFLTNLEAPDVIARAVPELYKAIEETNDLNEKMMRKSMPKYEFPTEVITAARFGWLAKYGQSLTIHRDECVMIRQLDAMKEQDKSIYGNAFLLSEAVTAEKAAAEKAAAEKAAAEKAAAQVWQLSDREREIVQSLGKNEQESDV